jgi:flagellar hook-associated protein 1 FlgK
MLGLFGTLNLTTRSLQVQQQGIEVAGHNLANVNNPAYARQRVMIATSPTVQAENGMIEGTGADVTAIQQVRSSILDSQLVSENSVTGSLEAQQQALQYAQSDLGQQIDRGATGAEGAAAAGGTGGQHAIGDAINDLFNSFQSLSTQPSSMTERDIVLNKATQLTDRFRDTDSRLASLSASINTDLDSDVSQVNSVLGDIAKLNQQIARAEINSNGAANDLRDSRQAKLEELGKLVKFDTSAGEAGAVNVSIGGVLMVDTTVVSNQLQTYDAGGGQMLVRAATGSTPLDITSGHIAGLIETRDGAVKTLRDDLSTLATSLITQINTLHQGGFGKDGSTGLAFFTGTNASDIRVNQTLIDDPGKIGASDSNGDVGNNKVIVAMAQLANAPQAALADQTFTQKYGRVVADLGASLSKVNQGISDQAAVVNMVTTQRDSVSAVSLDEEMADLVKFQRAYQASAQVVNVVNTMLETIINMVN